MEKPEKNRLLTDLNADQKEAGQGTALGMAHGTAMGMAENVDYEAFRFLKSKIANPPRANSSENSSFEKALLGLVQFLIKFSHDLPVSDLEYLACLEDIFKDVIYYLEDDPLYDVGHDFIHADYSKVRELAQKELERRKNTR